MRTFNFCSARIERLIWRLDPRLVVVYGLATLDLFDKNPVTGDSLSPILTREVKKHKNNLLVLRIEKGVPIEHMVKILDIGMRESFKVVLETEKTQ